MSSELVVMEKSSLLTPCQYNGPVTRSRSRLQPNTSTTSGRNAPTAPLIRRYEESTDDEAPRTRKKIKKQHSHALPSGRPDLTPDEQIAVLECDPHTRRIDYYGFRVYCGRCIRWIRLGTGRFRLTNWFTHCSRIHGRTTLAAETLIKAGMAKIAARDSQRLQKQDSGSETSPNWPAVGLQSITSEADVVAGSPDHRTNSEGLPAPPEEPSLEIQPLAKLVRGPEDEPKPQQSQDLTSPAVGGSAQAQGIAPIHCGPLSSGVDLIVQTRETDDNDLFADDEDMVTMANEELETTPVVRSTAQDSHHSSAEEEEDLDHDPPSSMGRIRQLTPESVNFGTLSQYPMGAKAIEPNLWQARYPRTLNQVEGESDNDADADEDEHEDEDFDMASVQSDHGVNAAKTVEAGQEREPGAPSESEVINVSTATGDRRGLDRSKRTRLPHALQTLQQLESEIAMQERGQAFEQILGEVAALALDKKKRKGRFLNSRAGFADMYW